MSIKQCKRCLFTSDIAKIYPDGECEYCKLHDEIERNHPTMGWSGVLKNIKRMGATGRYDVVMGISGGFDSALLLDYCVNKWGLRPLVVHFDNHYNTPEADYNIQQMIKLTGVDMIRYYVNKIQYDKMNLAMLMAGTPDADVPNDLVMTELMYRTARQYGIKYVINGHNNQTEGSTPKPWTYMDAKYLKSVYKLFIGSDMELPLFDFWRQVYFGFKGIRQVRPFYYNRYDLQKERERMMTVYALKDYGAKHSENVYTDFVGSWLLPVKFGIDKRRTYLSARIRSGLISRDEALQELNKEPQYSKAVKDLIGMYKPVVERSGVRSRFEYARYDFRKYRVLIWMMAKVGVVPWTFYVKYCK